MKMELTNELKARFFALYWGQKLKASYKNEYITHVGKDVTVRLDHANIFRLESIELRPLSSITEEEAKDYFEYRQGQRPNVDGCKEALFIWYQPNDLDNDWFRSKGFLVAYLGIPVDQWVEWGVVKLKQ